jgi:AcrR family transcriptional regulator
MVEKAKRPRGRPRSFEPESALDRAIPVFWTKGFDATSLDDLGAAMGIGRPSIYNTFGDKETLFVRCLERYRETVAMQPLRAAAAADTIEQAISDFLFGVARYLTADGCPGGCLIGSVGAIVDAPQIRESVRESIEATARELRRLLAEAVQAGELPEDFAVERAGRRAVNAMLSMSARARLGASPEELREDAADALVGVFAGSRGNDST